MKIPPLIALSMFALAVPLTNYDKVSAACKDALDNTGGGRGLGPRR